MKNLLPQSYPKTTKALGRKTVTKKTVARKTVGSSETGVTADFRTEKRPGCPR